MADPFVDNNSPYNSNNLGLRNEVNPSNTESAGQGFNTDKIQSITDLNLPAIAGDYKKHQFDVAIGWKVNDLTGGQMGMFEVADLGLTLADFGAIGLCGQETTGVGGSAKEFQLVASVPDAPIIFLLGPSLLGLGLLSWRKKFRK